MPRYSKERLEEIMNEKKEKVVRAAAEEFARVGYIRANTNLIAEKAGISVGSLFKYFGSKENCFLAVLEEGMVQLDHMMSVIDAEPGTIFDKLEKLISMIPEYSRTHEEMTRLYLEITKEEESEKIRAFGKRFEGFSAKAHKRVLKKAKENGEISASADEDLCAFYIDNLLMMLQFSYSCDYYKQRKKIYLGAKKSADSRLIVEQMVRFIKSGITAE